MKLFTAPGTSEGRSLKLFIAAGTSEGRSLAAFCEEHGIEAVVSVATSYGEDLLTGGEAVSVRCGRMDKAAMAAFLRLGTFSHAIDATHPYAVEVTKILHQVCLEQKLPYLRLIRGSGEESRGCTYVSAIEEAVSFLQCTEGNVLVTTGSKEIKAFQAIGDCTRLYPRILPDADSLAACEAVGIPRKNIIGMQGPFTKELNQAMMSQIDAKYLVTKESGQAGGFLEKIQACLETGTTAIVVRRPVEEEAGYTLAQVKELLMQGWEAAAAVTIAGIGPGAAGQMTRSVQEAIRDADICIGASRMLEYAKQEGKEVFSAYQGEQIAEFLKGHPNYRNAVVLVSGDTGFFSATKKLMEALHEWKPKILPGISSLVYFCSRIGVDWEDVKLCSHHGLQPALTDMIREHQKVFALFGKGAEIIKVCKQLSKCHMDAVKVSVGEALSYPGERILQGSPEDIRQQEIGDLSVALFVNEEAEGRGYPFGISDADFLRGKVPMTKEEVRTISLSKLKLKRDSQVYDVGAGTGSVSIEAALACPEGRIYAIEKNAEALELITENMEKFKVTNIRVVEGTAPDALAQLPVPTHAFIGGSSGNLEEILDVLLQKNPDIRLVLNAVSLETIAQITQLAGKMEFSFEVVSVQVARSRQAGSYHLMQGENPVMIFTLWREKG